MQKFWGGDSYAVRVVKAVEESGHVSARMVVCYNWVLRHRQHWMKYVYWFVNRFRPESRGPLYRRSLKYIHGLFEHWCPHVVVSVHPLTQHAFARVLKELGLAGKIPLVTVVTDPCYGFWKGWACDDVTLYLVASEDARRQLIDYGVQPERIKVSGMPVHPKFELPDERAAQAARRELGLDPQKFTVFVNAGWVGGGNIPQIFRELVRGELDVQAIFLAGRNEELRSEAESIAASAKFPVKVIGYSEQVEQLMQAANVMVSKLGGLTTFEALACRVPIIADTTTPPMPQESGAAQHAGSARRGRAPQARGRHRARRAPHGRRLPLLFFPARGDRRRGAPGLDAAHRRGDSRAPPRAARPRRRARAVGDALRLSVVRVDFRVSPRLTRPPPLSFNRSVRPKH